jgi:hypothetical protein
MESFHLYHLAACWTARATSISNPPPLATNPVDPILRGSRSSKQQITSSFPGSSLIKAAAAHMVFASRTSQDFITPQDVKELERWTGEVGDPKCPIYQFIYSPHLLQAVLNTLVNTEIPEQVHDLFYFGRPYADRGDRICMTKLVLYGKFSELWGARDLDDPTSS